MPYVFEQCLHVGAGYAVWRGWRTEAAGASPGQPVILKLLADAESLMSPSGGRSPREELEDRLHRHHAALRKMGGRGAPQVVGWETAPPGLMMANGATVRSEGPVLVMECTHAHPLGVPNGRGWDEARALLLGIELCRALQSLHGCDLVHGVLHPSHVLVDPDGAIRLCGLGWAAPPGQEWHAYGTPPDGSCCAPELTGLLPGQVDARADYYAIGVILYWVLTGRPPFLERDPAELAHAHVGRVPEAPDVLNPDISSETAAIVMRLLEKDPELRYQSVTALLSDLQGSPGGSAVGLAQSGGGFGSGDAVLLRAATVPDTPFFLTGGRGRGEPPEKLYGRQREKESLRDALLQAVRGRNGVLLLRGVAGIGKTALLETIGSPSGFAPFRVVRGHFEELQGNAPFGTLMAAFSQALRQVLAGDEATLSAVRTRLQTLTVGQAQATVWMLTEAMPSLTLFIGTHARKDGAVEAETEGLFRDMFLQFLRALIGPGETLVLVLDDLHRADRSTLGLLHHLLLDDALRHMLVVGTVREDGPGEIGGDGLADFLATLDKSDIPVRHVPVGPLTVDDVQAILQHSFGPVLDNASALAEVCQKRTFGNPLFLRRFLAALHERRVIRFDGSNGRWRWDAAAVPHMLAPENLIGFLTQSLRDVTPFTRTVLQMAACIGLAFSTAELGRVIGVPAVALDAALTEAERMGLILPCSGPVAERHVDNEGEDTSSDCAEQWYRFQHERIHEAVYQGEAPEGRASRHARIGLLRLEEIQGEWSERQLFAALDQINRGHSSLSGEPLRDRIARLNLDAARASMATAGYASALSYARSGIALLTPQCWTVQQFLALGLHTVAAEAAYVLRDWPVLDGVLDEVLGQPLGPLERAKALELRVLSCSARTDVAAAVDVALDAVARLGYPVPKARTVVGRLVLAGRLILAAYRLDRKEPTVRDRSSPVPEAVLRLLVAVSAARHISRPELAPAMALRVVELALQLRDAQHIGYARAMLSVVHASRGHHQRAAQMAARALKHLEMVPSRSLKARAMLPALYMGLHWREPLRQTRKKLMECHRVALVSGDMETAGYALTAGLEHGLFSGVSLREQGEDAVRALTFLRRYPNAVAMPYAEAISRFLSVLSDVNAPLDPVRFWQDQAAEAERLQASGNSLVAFGTVLLALVLLVQTENFTQAGVVLTTVDGLQWRGIGTASRPIHVMYGAIAVSRDGRRSRRSKLARLRQAIARFEVWTADCPVQHLHRLLLLRAEEARLQGSLDASDLYARALQAARDNDNPGEEGVILSAAAAFHDGGHRAAVAAMLHAQALETLTQWGGLGVADLLRKQWPDTRDTVLRSLAADRRSTTGGALGGALGGTPGGAMTARMRSGAGPDPIAVMRAAQAISGEVRRPEILEQLMRITMSTMGAQRGVLLLKGAGGWTLEADGEADSERFVVHRLQVPLADETTSGGEYLPFCRGIFNYVVRTGETVVLDNATRGGDFTADPYVLRSRPQSVLAMPLYQRGDLTGVLYLENNLITGLFTLDRLDVLRLLMAQVMVSLENAHFYENMAALNRDLERQVEERSRDAMEKTRLLEATLDNMSDGLILFDAQGRMMVWNQRAVDLFGIPPALRRRGVSQAALISSTIATGVLSERLAGILMERQAAGRPAYPDKMAAEVELAGDLHIQVRRRFMSDGGEVQIYLDVTEERRRERELLLARRDAERALDDLRTAQVSLIQAEKMASLGELVAGVAHEINTPIGITLTAASFLSERTREIRQSLEQEDLRKSQLQLFVEQASETTALMESNIRRAADLITSFKQIAVDQSSGDRRSFNVEDYLWEVIRSFTPMLRKAGHTLSLSCPQNLVIESYPGAWSQILTNFVTNSIDHAYTPGEHGRLRVVVTMIQPGLIEMAYSDDGRGIPAENRGRIFDPFFTTRRGVGGSGLGLHIVFNLITGLLHGSVTGEENPGGGTRMIVRVPVAVVDGNPDPVVSSSAAAGGAAQGPESLQPASDAG